MFVTLYILLSPGSCTIWLGETSWHGVDPGVHTKGLFPTSSPLPSPTPMQDVAVLCLLQRSIWLLLAFDALFGRCRWCCFCERFSGFRPPHLVFVGGCGWRLWLVFVFWRFGLLPALLLFFCLGGPAPSVVFLLLLVVGVGHGPAGRCRWRLFLRR